MKHNQKENAISTVYKLAERDNNLIRATIELLTKCNWRCKHCYIPSHDSDGLSKELVFNILEQLRDMGTFEVIFTGGEIFFRKDTMDIIKKAREMFFDVVLFTNVSILSEEIIKELSELCISRISCTIFSLNADVHDSITGIKGSLKKVIKNIMLIKKYNIPLEIKTVLMQSNYNAYKELKYFCDDNGFLFSPTSIVTVKNDGDNSPKSLRICDEKLEEVIHDIDKINKVNFHTVSLDEYVCNSIRYSICIGNDGEVYPCDTMNISVGNIYTEPIKDIWNESKELKYIRELKWNDLKECVKCNDINYCYKCPGITLLEEGNLLSKSLLACTHASIRHKLSNYKRGEINGSL